MTVLNIAEVLELHKKWLEDEPGGVRANLRHADLRGADLDWSCLPLWCGFLGMIVDRRIAAQIAYHFCALTCDDDEVKALQESLYDFANEMHRQDVPRLEKRESNTGGTPC